jgi:membrane protein required for colicin V production
MVIDIILFIFAGWGFYRGFSTGIIKTVFTVLSFVIGLLAAFKFAPAATRFLETAFNTNEPLLFIAGFLLAFVATMFFIRMIARALEGLLRTANVNFINKLAGGVLSAAMMVLMFSVLVWFGDKSHLIKEETRRVSYSYPYLKEFPTQMRKVYDRFKPTFQEFWDETIEFMDRMEEMSIERTESDPGIFDIPEEKEKGAEK